MYATMHLWMHACIHPCINACFHAPVHISNHSCMHSCIHAPCTHLFMQSCIHACIYLCIHACIHTYNHTCSHVWDLFRHVLDMCLPQVLDVLKIFSKLSQKCFRWFQSGLRRASDTFQACFSFKPGFKMIQIYFGNVLVTCHRNHSQQINIKHDVTKPSNRISQNSPTHPRPADGGWSNAILPLP